MKKSALIGILSFLVIVFFTGINTVSASMSIGGITNPANNFKVEANDKNMEGLSIVNHLSIDKQQRIDIKHPINSVYSNYGVSGDRMNFTEILTATDPSDF